MFQIFLFKHRVSFWFCFALISSQVGGGKFHISHRHSFMSVNPDEGRYRDTKCRCYRLTFPPTTWASVLIFPSIPGTNLVLVRLYPSEHPLTLKIGTPSLIPRASLAKSGVSPGRAFRQPCGFTPQTLNDRLSISWSSVLISTLGGKCRQLGRIYPAATGFPSGG